MAIASGIEGNPNTGCPWEIDDSGVLTIGAGEITHSTDRYSNWGWYPYRTQITSVVTTGVITWAEGANAYGMFFGCSNATSLDLSNFDTSNVTTMTSMFRDCSSLTSLDLSNFDTSNVTDMHGMFEFCGSLISLDLSNFDTSNVTNMDYMFSACDSLTLLDLSNFNTSNVTNMDYMFQYCQSLTLLDLSNFVTYHVTDMVRMFDGCKSLTSLDLPYFDTRNTTSMNGMFWRCESLISIAVSSLWNVDSVISSSDMFTGCNKLIGEKGTVYNSSYTDKTYAHLDEGVSNPGYLSTTSYTEMYASFNSENGELRIFRDTVKKYTDNQVINTITYWTGIEDITKGTFPKWYDVRSNIQSVNIVDEFSPKTAFCMFYGCNLLTSLNLSNLNTSNVTDMRYMFQHCQSLTSLDLSNFDTSNVTNMYSMFSNCSSLTLLDLSNFDISNVTNVSYMFYDCNLLTSLNLSNLDTNNVTNMSYMFDDCNSLTSLDLSNFDTSNVTNMRYMFYRCNQLTSLNLSNFDTSNVIDMYGTFCYCESLTLLDLSNFDTSNVTNMNYMFYGCALLKWIAVSNLWDISTTQSQGSGDGMFSGCTNLKGGAGTVYNSSYTNIAYAHIDGGQSNPGYLSDIMTQLEAFAEFDNSNGLLRIFKDFPGTYTDEQVIGTKTYWTGLENITGTTPPKWIDVASQILNISIEHKFCPQTAWQLFYNCSNLTSLQLYNLDTSQIGNMHEMFKNCISLTSLDFNNLDLSSATWMVSMFENCRSLTYLELYVSDTGGVFWTDIFKNTVYPIYIINVETGSAAESVARIWREIVFSYLNAHYEADDVSPTSTFSVSIDEDNPQSTVAHLQALIENVATPIPNSWNLSATTKILTMDGVIQTPTWTEQTTDDILLNTDINVDLLKHNFTFSLSYNILNENNNIKREIQIGPINAILYGYAVGARLDMVEDDGQLTIYKDRIPDGEIDGTFYYSDIQSVEDDEAPKWYNQRNLITYLQILDTFVPQTGYYLFSLPKLEDWDIDKLVLTSQVTNISGMFAEDAWLTQSHLLDITMPNTITTMESTFEGCTNLTTDRTSNGTDLLSNWDTSNVTNWSKCFKDCTNLEGNISIKSTDIPNTSNYANMFGNPSDKQIYLIPYTSNEVSNIETLRTIIQAIKNERQVGATTVINIHAYTDDIPKPSIKLSSQQRGTYDSTIDPVWKQDDEEGRWVRLITDITISSNYIPDREVTNEFDDVTVWINNEETSDYVQTVEGSTYIYYINLDTLEESNVKLEIFDKFHSTVKVYYINKIIVLLDFYPGGEGMAIGKEAERNGFEVRFPTAIGDHLQPAQDYHFIETTDTEVDINKTYYTDDTGTIEVTPDGTENPSEERWYEKEYIEGTIDLENYQLIVGKYNKVDNNALFIVGNGSNNNPSNLMEVGTDLITIGDKDKIYTELDENGQRFYQGNDIIANIGYGEGQGESGTVVAPYYTLGTRISGSIIGNYSVSEGYETRAGGAYSHAQGLRTISAGWAQTALGKYNILDNVDTYAIIIGNGTADNARSNALAVDWNGRVECGDYNGNFKSILDIFYPVGSYYETSLDCSINNHTYESGDLTAEEIALCGVTWFDPRIVWGGNWVKDSAGRVTVAQDTTDTSFDVIGETGGDKNIQAHSHNVNWPTVANNSHTHTPVDTANQFVSTSSSGEGVKRRTIKAGSGTSYSNNYYGGDPLERKAVTTYTHSHGLSGGGVTTVKDVSTGQSGNLQPYVVVIRWHRIPEEN